MFRKRRKLNVIVAIIFIGLVAGNNGVFFKMVRAYVQIVLTFCNSTNVKIAVSGVAMLITFIMIKKIWNSIVRIRLHKKRQKSIAALSPSGDRDEYIIERDDYRRGNPKESYYRKTFCLYLLDAFGNCCARCGNKENGMDIDHFIFSKNEGGCFIMRHRDGHLINNAIPLCRTCNRSKSDESYASFFSEAELLAILEKNVLMTRRLNAKSIFNVEGKIIKQKIASSG